MSVVAQDFATIIVEGVHVIRREDLFVDHLVSKVSEVS